MTDLFTTHRGKHSTILLIDASGSVKSDRILFNDNLVFDQMKKIINELDEEEYWVIFWNSDRNANEIFTNGVYKIPFIVKKSTIDQMFTYVRQYINPSCLTFPHLAFDSISEKWISNVNPTKIYFITDGEMGFLNIGLSEKNGLKQSLSNSIKQLFTKYNNVQLNIVTIEPKIMDFTQMETLQRAAGCDVYNVIMENQLTKYITKFVSYTLNNLNGFLHINKNIPPPGFVPFGDKCFSELRMNDFIVYLMDIISKTTDENELLKIVQYLSSTICMLTKDKPKHMSDAIVRTFCGLFANTSLDMMFVQFIVTDAVKKENAGMANVFAAYRHQLKNLYQQANALLQQNIKQSIGIGETFLTLPIENKLVSGHFRLIEKDLIIDKITYPQSSIILPVENNTSGIMLPVIPFDYQNHSVMNEQCLRQWMRQLVHRLHGVNATEDIIIYIVLSMVLQVSVSDVDPAVKYSFQRLGTIMLKKKRLNTDITELSRLETGELPTPNNGRIEEFYRFMNWINHRFSLSLQPMTLWYALCLSLNNQNLIIKQLIHCKESIEKDFAKINPDQLLAKLKDMIPAISYHQIPFENVLDYHCLITLEDTTETGGYQFLPHQNLVGSTCCPICVLSTEGYHQLVHGETQCVCPICYTYLGEESFRVVDKKKSMEELVVFPAGTIDIFNANDKTTTTRRSKGNSIKLSGAYIGMISLSKKGTLVILRGTVGSGKSTIASAISKRIEEINGYCITVGTDKYSRQGISLPDAVSKIYDELMEFIDKTPTDGKPMVVIIDTCGEKIKSNTIFGISFSGWKKVNYWPNLNKSNMDGYLAWSLRNVLIRGKVDQTSNYYLNPVDADVQTCVNVHWSKALTLFGKKLNMVVTEPYGSKEEIIGKINDAANSYQQLLDATMKLDDTVACLFAKKNIN